MSLKGKKDNMNGQPNDFISRRGNEDTEVMRKPKHPFLKWALLTFLLSIILIIIFHAPILSSIGRGLILEYPAERSDMIVCLGGKNIERGLASADAYKKELAGKILLTRPCVPDDYDIIRAKGLDYPEEADLLRKLLVSAGVPDAAIIQSNVPVYNTLDEAASVRKAVEKEGARSLMIITSPMHSRRAWRTYMKVFEDTDVKILSLPSGYSHFNPDSWWKDRWYLKEVFIEYEKLIYYILKYRI